MKRITTFFTLFIIVFSIQKTAAQHLTATAEIERQNINKMLDDFNVAAATADYNKYFGYYLRDSYFLGTDATERWNKKAFMIWAKPYFNDKKTWNFKSLERNIYFSTDGKIAWFDELLDTQMKICRGSGVLEKTKDSWKIRQYVLSMTIPNALSNEVTKLKAPIEDGMLKTFYK